MRARVTPVESSGKLERGAKCCIRVTLNPGDLIRCRRQTIFKLVIMWDTTPIMCCPCVIAFLCNGCALMSEQFISIYGLTPTFRASLYLWIMCRGRGWLARPESKCGSLSLSVARYWSRHGPPSLSSLSITSLATIRHRPRPPLDTRTDPPWSQHYLDLAISGLFPLINKTHSDTQPRVTRECGCGGDYLPNSRPRLNTSPGSQSSIIMSLFIVTNVRISGPRVTRNAAPDSLWSRQFVEKPQSQYQPGRHWYSSSHHRPCFKLKFLSHSHSSSRICAMWGTGLCCGILVTYQDPTFERSKS